MPHMGGNGITRWWFSQYESIRSVGHTKPQIPYASSQASFYAALEAYENVFPHTTPCQAQWPYKSYGSNRWFGLWFNDSQHKSGPIADTIVTINIQRTRFPFIRLSWHWCHARFAFPFGRIDQCRNGYSIGAIHPIERSNESTKLHFALA